MSDMPHHVSSDQVDRLYERLNREAETAGYHLNPDVEFTRELVEGLLVNEQRYGYWACPCRLADGIKEEDLDIICPCDYRDPDLDEHGACYCALYVSQAIVDGEKKVRPVPERRPTEEERKAAKAADATEPVSGPGPVPTLPLPVWRCKVCGYLAARASPPPVCPICKAKRDRFERFM